MLESPAHQRTLVGAPAVLRWQPVDGDGVAGDPGTTTVTVTRADGTVLATDQATTGTGTEERTYTLAGASNGQVDRLTATWSSADLGEHTTIVEVVGGFLVNVADVRTLEPAVADPNRYPDAALVAARLTVEQKFDSICSRAFVPTLKVGRYRGGYCALVLEHPDLIEVQSTSAGGVDVATIAPSSAGIAEAATAWPCDTFTVRSVHGMAAIPGEIRRAAARMIRHELVATNSAIPERAITWGSTELGGTATLATPGVRDWHTGIPAVDEALERYTWKPPLIA